MAQEKGCFKVINKKDGCYLELSGNEQETITFEAIYNYFKYIEVKQYNSGIIKKAIQEKSFDHPIKLTNSPIPDKNEFVIIDVQEDFMSASATFYPPVSKGKRMTEDDILLELQKKGVTFGVDMGLLREMQQCPTYFTKISIAKGKKVRQGKNGEILYHFDIDRIPRPTILEDGSVDYHELDFICRVNSGDKLATILPAVEGKSGTLVNGKVILPARVKTPRLHFGKHIKASEDGLEAFSEITGHVVLDDDKIIVSNTLEIQGNVDASTGDITYDGDVRVDGNVTSGYSIKAAGQVIVNGVVEGATIESEGPIVIRGGIQGQMQANIISASDITTKFIEQSNVSAGGNVTTDAILHSKVSAKRSIIVLGRRGLIIGGEIKSGKEIHFKVAGSEIGATTNLEVGIDPHIVERHKSINAQLPKLIKEKEQAVQFLLLFRSKLRNGASANNELTGKIQQFVQRLPEVSKEINDYMEELGEIEEVMEFSGEGVVTAEEKVYPGVRLTMGSAVKQMKTEAQYCRFVKNGEDIVIKGMV